MKSTPGEIRDRFDKDVERFSDLDAPQLSAIDAQLSLGLISNAAAAVNPGASDLLDIGCGAGNCSLKLLQQLPLLNVTLLDLSRPMLDRALQRICPHTAGVVTAVQEDIRSFEVGESRFDIILSGAALHHLRGDDEWESLFTKCHAALKPGGSFWVFDLIEHQTPQVQELMWRRYGEYLASVRNTGYRDEVFANIKMEDTPRPLLFQLELMSRVGFHSVEVLHKNSCFAAFGAIK